MTAMADTITTPPNIAEFNRMVGVVFDILYEAFPIPQEIGLCEEYKIARSLDLTDEVTEPFSVDNPPVFAVRPLTSGANFAAMLWGVMKWLDDEGFIRSCGEAHTIDVVLTSKAITVLGASPDGGGPTLGERLKKAAKAAGSAAGSASLNQAVVQVIGFAFRHTLGA